MRRLRWATTALALVALAFATPGAQAADPAPTIHVVVDTSDKSDQGERLRAALGTVLDQDPVRDTLDGMHMPFMSQVRYHRPADQALAQRIMLEVRPFRPQAALVPLADAGSDPRIEIFLSLQDFHALARPDAPPPPPSIVDAPFNVVFDPDDTSKDPLKSTTPAMRAFLAAAKQADAIADPMARCLAYPDLPGSHWPRELVRARCEYSNGPALALAEFKAYVQRGDFDGLEARLRADLQRHLDIGDGHSEVIDRDFAVFFKFNAGDAIQAWRQRRPESAFALAADSALSVARAWHARGEGTADKISDRQFADMHRFAAQGIAAARAALAIDPRLLPAWVVLIDLGQIDGQDELREEAYRQAPRLDPACYDVAMAQMYSLLPRWGGSLGQMDTLAQSLFAQQDARPLVRLVAVMPDWGRALDAGDRHDNVKVAELLKPHANAVPSVEALQTLGLMYSREVVNGEWQGIAYLLETVRFGGCRACTRYSLANDLMGVVADRDWALTHLRRTVDADPEDWTAQMMIGQALHFEGRYPEAIKQLEFVLAHEPQGEGRRGTLELLVAATDKSGKATLSKKYAEQLAHEFPHPRP